jgi:hypothetical protein
VVDASESMGIPATQAGIDTMKSVTPGSCALACHVPQVGLPVGTKSNEQYARANAVTLRLDIVKQAINDILAEETNDVMNKYYQFSVYPFAYYKGPFKSPSNDYTTLIDQVNGIT